MEHGERDTDWKAIAARPWILVLEAMRAVLRDVWRHEEPTAA
jgi:hypothetical protein